VPLDLYNDIFLPVSTRVINRRDSLQNIKQFTNVGIEGWFKVEIVAALSVRVASVNNKGPDLTLIDQTKIEIKATTNFNKSWITDPLKKYGSPVLFLADGNDLAKFMIGRGDIFEVIGYKLIHDGNNTWLLGMVKPKLGGS